MRNLIKILIPMLLSCAGAQAQDEFTKARCDADIVNALKGQRMSNDRIVVTEARHKYLGLKHLGTDQISDGMNSISWLICGTEIVALEQGSVIRDVIAFPPHSKTSPGFGGFCQLNGRKSKGVIIAVLDGASGRGELLPAKAAWRIDEKAARFVKMDTSDMLCPRSGAYTTDGGK